MILATKAEVDEARTELSGDLDALATAIARWQTDPTNPTKVRDARNALDRAESAFDDYDTVLKTWAAGPGGDAT